MTGMKQKARQVVCLLAVGIGVGLLLWGAGLHAEAVFSEDNDKGLATPESVLMKEVSIGGLRRDEAGRLTKTYTGQAPQACPT